MAARKRIWTPDIVRERIKVGMLVHCLQKQALNGGGMDANQLRAIEILLKKTLPDLSAVAHSGSIETTRPEELTDERLADIASPSRNRIVEAPSSEAEPDSVH